MNLIAWAEIPNYPGYLVSTQGEVYSLPRKTGNQFSKGRILKKTIRNGYFNVNLSKNGKGNNKKISRLVAFAFHPNPENKAEVNHIDCDKLNDSFINLEWTTRKENQQHAHKNGLTKNVFKTGADHPNFSISKETVLKAFELRIKHNKSYSQIAKDLKVSTGGIYKAMQKVSV